MSKVESRSGGCQCGAMRFKVTGELGGASICHCRMCQKAFGGFFGPLVSAKKGSLTWTRGELSHFQSSNAVKRGFCKNCGTPLTFEHMNGVELAIGAFDDPLDIAPTSQLAIDKAVPYFPQLHDLHIRQDNGVAQTPNGEPIISYQHPDHDTNN